MTIKQTWTTKQVEQCRQLRAEGHSYREIARIMGRTRSGVRYAVNLNDCRPVQVRQANDEPPVQKVKQVREKSDKLRDAIMAAFSRMPERVVREILCPQAAAEPGTERIYKTASIERLAA